jgi:hypothetical protein
MTSRAGGREQGDDGHAGKDDGCAAGTDWNGARALALYSVEQKRIWGHEGLGPATCCAPGDLQGELRLQEGGGAAASGCEAEGFGYGPKPFRPWAES